MDAVILERPFPKVIRFDLKERLIRVHKLIHDRHVESINKGTLKMAAFNYKGLSYMAAGDDRIEPPECLAAGISRDSNASIDEDFE